MNPILIKLTPELLASIAGIILTLSFTYIPGWRVMYAELSSEKKSLIMLGCLVVVTSALYLLVKFGVLLPDQPVNGWTFFWMLYLTLTGNQIVYKISPQPNDVKTAKAQRIPIKNGNTDAG